MQVYQRVVFALGVAIAAGCATTGGAEKGSSDVVTVNPSFVVNADKAMAGGKVYRDKACLVCHNIGNGQQAGPDLFGVVERRDVEWLKKFLLDTTNMLETDPIAHAMLEQHRFQKMPNMRLTEEQAENLIHYLQAETTKKRGG